MRLISCHIENFGKLSDETFKFGAASGLNVICKDNGWGKSTFAAFIKVMFFGFDNEGKRNELENERKRFKPWQGGVYGGQVTFETDGNTYIMSRTFGSKEKDDEFILQDAETNLETADFSKNIGEELFQIDRASFLRSIYISQNDCKTKATDSINAKLGNLSESTDDLNNFETANKKIADKLNSLSKRRKTGILYKQREQIADLKQKIKNGESIDGSMDEILKLENELNESYLDLKDEQKKLQDKQKEISEYKDLEVKRNEYKHLCEDFEKKQIAFEKTAEYFPESIPEVDEVDKYIKVANDALLLKKEADIYKLDEGELSEVKFLEDSFATDIPDSEAINEKYKSLQFIQDIIQKIEKNMLTVEEKNKFKQISDKFHKGIPSQEEIDNILKAWSVKNEKKNMLSSKKATAEMLARAGAVYDGNPDKDNYVGEDNEGYSKINDGFDKGKVKQSDADNTNRAGSLDDRKTNVAIWIILIMAVIVVGDAVIYLLTKSLPFCLIFAFLVGIAGAFLIKKANNNRIKDAGENSKYENGTGKANLYHDLIREISEDEKLIAETERETAVFLEEYNILYDEGCVVEELYKLKEEVKTFIYLSEKSSAEDVETLWEQYIYAKENIINFLEKYGFINDELGGMGKIYGADEITDKETVTEEMGWLTRYGDIIRSLEKAVNNYIVLKEKKNKYDLASRLYEEKINLLEIFITGLDMETGDDIFHQLQEIKEVLRDYLKAKEDCDKAEELMKLFEKNHNDIEKIKNAEIREGLSLSDIEGRLNEISSEIEKYHNLKNDYNNRLEQLQEKKDNIIDYENRLEELQEVYGQNEKKEKMLQKTQQYLGQAKASLVAKYTKPVKDSFDKYLNVLSEIESGLYQLDADFNMSVVEHGLPRDTRFLSTGCQDMVGICMRMALVDAMYEGEKPFVVFDDSFVNFDSKKTEGGLKLLAEIAKKYQVIYFTCNEVRSNPLL